ncbi:MAG: hypothetical protein KIT43_14465 [Bauldia sp.]|nr:hypothetical protein [Bauldia sp.]
MSEIRTFGPDDVPAVAAMFQRTFRDRAVPAPASLAQHIGDVFLRHPWYDPEVASRVHVSDAGVVNGFIGILPLPLVVGERRLRSGMAGSLMVEDPSKDPLAGARLLRSFLNGPQDISLSETANLLSQRMWERLGGTTVTGLSLDWMRVFRPAGLAIDVASGRIRAARLGRPVAAMCDSLARRAGGGFFRATAPDGVEGREVDEAGLMAALDTIPPSTGVRPDWTAEVLQWVLRTAEVKEQRGPFHRRVMTARGTTIGAAVFYGEPKSLAWVLHVTARPGAEAKVMEELLAYADVTGFAGMRGRVTPALHETLLRQKAFFFRRGAFVAHSRDPALVTALADPAAVVTGLAGESWIRLIGGTFR